LDPDLAESLGEGDVLLRRDLLVAEEHDAEFEERVADLVDRVGRQRTGEVDSSDLRAHRR
jgi:hypothetical protein